MQAGKIVILDRIEWENKLNSHYENSITFPSVEFFKLPRY